MIPVGDITGGAGGMQGGDSGPAISSSGGLNVSTGGGGSGGVPWTGLLIAVAALGALWIIARK